MRQQPEWTDPREAVAEEGTSAEQGHRQREDELKEKPEAGRSACAALEDKFRLALTTAAARFSQVCCKMDTGPQVAFNHRCPTSPVVGLKLPSCKNVND